jgi:hypothetical protein
MDATRYWSRFPGNFVTPDGKYVKDILPPGPKFKGSVKEWYETLILTVEDCINDLQKATFSKYGRAKRLALDVYVAPDIACIFESSVLLKLPSDDAEAPDGLSRAVGRFELSGFNVWEDKLMSNDVIRIVATFDVEDGADKSMYGNVKILDMPENSRRT